VDSLTEELEDRVEQIFSATESLRELAGDGKATRQLLDSIFRNVHGLKATASSNELKNLANIAHQFENLLHALRTGKARITDDVLRVFDDTSDAMFSSLRDTDSDTATSFNSLFERLQFLSEGSSKTNRLEVDVILHAIPNEIFQALRDEEKHRLQQVLGEGASLFLITTSFDPASFDQRFQSLKETLTREGELISTAPQIRDDAPGKIDFRILYARESELDSVKQELSDQLDIVVSEISPQATKQNIKSHSVGSRYDKRSTSSAPYLIRIELDDLDRLISSTHQLFRDTDSCLDQAITNSDQSALLRSKAEAVSSSFMALASELVNLRMVPIDRVLQRAFRAGRSVAVAADKKVEINVVGHDLAIDKSLADAISDPLIHLMRNAVDHGIEDESRRVSAGKNPLGKISIEATTLQGQTRIRVTDDGRGIDPHFICAAGRRLGVLAHDKQLDLEQSVRLLFRPGFTTATAVSEASGRGVGLDVVETAIEEVGGAIRVDSRPGVGSMFEIQLPATFSLLNVVVLHSGDRRHLIDAAYVSSSQVMNSIDPQVDIGSTSVLTLEDLLEQEATPSASSVLVYCNFKMPNSQQSKSVRLQVSKFETAQLLVRNLGSHSGRWLGVVGAAEMRDGKVALLLDLPTLVARHQFASL